ncbi:hypothetical protein K7432_015717 [Basidiobolus ranarum]|uniref:DUF4396 domain-containing protein n=1 Tax=Basidiobolus ranarum TaxID=34480 RepID=A0ABR2VMP6_9FUNG
MIRAISITPSLRFNGLRLSKLTTLPRTYSTCCHHKTEEPSKESSQLSIRKLSFWSDTGVWKRAGVNTTRCLIGCSLGDLTMFMYLTNYHPEVPILYSMPLSMAAGLCTSISLETVFLFYKERFGSLKQAFRTAAGMSMISMLVMEASENLVNLYASNQLVKSTGCSLAEMTLADSGVTTIGSILSVSMLAGFLAPLPYNYYKLKKYGRGCH